MKYTALFMIILGIVIVCCAGVLYASVGADREENLFVLGVAFPVVCAVALVTTGTGLWVLSGREYTFWAPASGRHPTGGYGGSATADPSRE